MISLCSSALDAELIAIELGIKAALLDAPPDLKQLVIFSNSVKAIRLAVDPSIHSSQQRSLNIASRLRAWFGYGDERKILFVHVSKKLGFWFQKHAHDLATSDKVPLPPKEPGTLDSVLTAADDRCQQEWIRLFRLPAFRGHHFLDLKRGKKRLKPTDRKGGPWLSAAGSSNSLMARLPRALTDHSPIGSYRERF